MHNSVLLAKDATCSAYTHIYIHIYMYVCIGLAHIHTRGLVSWKEEIAPQRQQAQAQMTQARCILVLSYLIHVPVFDIPYEHLEVLNFSRICTRTRAECMEHIDVHEKQFCIQRQ